MSPTGNRARKNPITPEEQERAKTLMQKVVEPYLKQYFPFVDLNHPHVRVAQKARSRPRQSVVTDRPAEKPALFCFTYASPPNSPAKRVVQVFVEATAEEGKIVHVAASK